MDELPEDQIYVICLQLALAKEKALADDANFVINLMMTSPHEDKYEEVERWQNRYRLARGSQNAELAATPSQGDEPWAPGGDFNEMGTRGDE